MSNVCVNKTNLDTSIAAVNGEQGLTKAPVTHAWRFCDTTKAAPQKLGYPRITMDTAPGATGATAAISKAPQPKNWWRNTKAVVQLLRRCRCWISWILEKLVFHLSS